MVTRVTTNSVLPGLLLVAANPLVVRTFWVSLFALTRQNPVAPEWMRFAGQADIPVLPTSAVVEQWVRQLASNPEPNWDPKRFVNTRDWGPLLWSLLHSVTAMVTEPQHDEPFRTWINTFANILPCRTCTTEFRRLLKRFNLRHYTGQSCVKLGIELHNGVNQRIGKVRRYHPESLAGTLSRQKLIITTEKMPFPPPVRAVMTQQKRGATQLLRPNQQPKPQPSKNPRRLHAHHRRRAVAPKHKKNRKVKAAAKRKKNTVKRRGAAVKRRGAAVKRRGGAVANPKKKKKRGCGCGS